MPRVVKFTEKECGIEVTEGWRGRGAGSSCFMGKAFQFEMMKELWRWMVVTVA